MRVRAVRLWRERVCVCVCVASEAAQWRRAVRVSAAAAARPLRCIVELFETRQQECGSGWGTTVARLRVWLRLRPPGSSRWRLEWALGTHFDILS